MPELPEVEVLRRHLAPLLQNKIVRSVRVARGKVVAPSSMAEVTRGLRGATFIELSRRGKYLVFALRQPKQAAPLKVLAHLGMTGRMYLVSPDAPIPRHAAVVMDLGTQQFIFEDTRQFGRFTLDLSALEKLGPEPLEARFTPAELARALAGSRQAIKLKLLDQTVVAGVGNIYASEALFRAGISPLVPARELKAERIGKLWQSVREVLAEAIDCGSTVPLNFSGAGRKDGLFYFGRVPGTPDFYAERLRVYDRADQPCTACGASIRRRLQAARSTYYCPRCQRR